MLQLSTETQEHLKIALMNLVKSESRCGKEKETSNCFASKLLLLPKKNSPRISSLKTGQITPSARIFFPMSAVNSAIR